MATEQTLDQRYQQIRQQYADYTEHSCTTQRNGALKGACKNSMLAR